MEIYDPQPQCPQCSSFFIITYWAHGVDPETEPGVNRCLDCLHRWEAGKDTWVVQS